MKCPVCKKKHSDLYKPFCSIRCKQVDLLNWISGSYKLRASDESNTDTHENND